MQVRPHSTVAGNDDFTASLREARVTAAWHVACGAWDDPMLIRVRVWVL